MKKLLLLGLLFALPAHADIAIGLIGPLSGAQATFGEQLRAGTAQAVEDINKAGGVLGQNIRLETADDACDPKQAVTAANQMVSKGVKYVIGPFCSASAIPASKVMIDEKSILVSPAATNPKLTDEGGPTIFRVCGRDDQQGDVVANLLLKDFKNAKIALIHDNSAWGKGVVDVAKAKLNAGGVKEVLYQVFTPGEKDYSSLVTSLKQQGAEVIFMGAYHTEAGLITRQLRNAGSKAQIIGGDALASEEFWSIAGPAAEGVLMSFGPDARKNPAAAGVVENLIAKHTDASGYTLYSYAAIQIVADAIKAAGSPDPVKVADAMHKQSFKTVLGQVDFDAKGDVKKPSFIIYRWHAGKYAER
jgi:branched-chain amino acid transport system substrate-binding protein